MGGRRAEASSADKVAHDRLRLGGIGHLFKSGAFENFRNSHVARRRIQLLAAGLGRVCLDDFGALVGSVLNRSLKQLRANPLIAMVLVNEETDGRPDRLLINRL